MTELDDPGRSALLDFVGTQILPHEAEARQQLVRLGVSAEDRDDILQEVYCRMLTLASTDHIVDPRDYMLKATYRVLGQKIRKSRVVPIRTMQNLEALDVADRRTNPEVAATSRSELKHVLDLIRALPERCRAVFVLRKVHGFSQAETASKLSLSENIVEKETAKGLNLILGTLALKQLSGEPSPRRRRKPLGVVNAVD